MGGGFRLLYATCKKMNTALLIIGSIIVTIIAVIFIVAFVRGFFDDDRDQHLGI